MSVEAVVKRKKDHVRVTAVRPEACRRTVGMHIRSDPRCTSTSHVFCVARSVTRPVSALGRRGIKSTKQVSRVKMDDDCDGVVLVTRDYNVPRAQRTLR